MQLKSTARPTVWKQKWNAKHFHIPTHQYDQPYETKKEERERKRERQSNQTSKHSRPTTTGLWNVNTSTHREIPLSTDYTLMKAEYQSVLSKSKVKQQLGIHRKWSKHKEKKEQWRIRNLPAEDWTVESTQMSKPNK